MEPIGMSAVGFGQQSMAPQPSTGALSRMGVMSMMPQSMQPMAASQPPDWQLYGPPPGSDPSLQLEHTAYMPPWAQGGYTPPPWVPTPLGAPPQQQQQSMAPAQSMPTAPQTAFDPHPFDMGHSHSLFPPQLVAQGQSMANPAATGMFMPTPPQNPQSNSVYHDGDGIGGLTLANNNIAVAR